MRVSKLLALAALVGLVPGTIYVAYLGFRAGLYPYAGIPAAFGVAFVVAIAALFVVLPVVRRYVDRVRR